jgi:hypothetical protein
VPSSRRGSALRRRAGGLEQRERFLVYVEGEVSESLYLNGVRRELGRSGPNIEIGGTHGEPLGLIRAAIDHRERERQDGNPFTQVWCVFDVESPTPHGALDQALTLAGRNKITCGISNPCFELWLMLHFQDQRGWLTTEEACDRLARLGCGYNKHGKAFNYELCMSGRQTAAERADALGARYDDTVPPRGRNPWTDVQRLFQALRDACGA